MNRYTIARQPRLIAGEDSLEGLPDLLHSDGRRAPAVITGDTSGTCVRSSSSDRVVAVTG